MNGSPQPEVEPPSAYPAMTHPPLKRHRALVPLSREHFNGLVQARRLRAAADAGPDERRQAGADFLAHWSAEMSDHFDDEERLLGPLLGAADRRRLLAEHARVRALAEQVRIHDARVVPTAECLRALGTLLEEHIRWEEREVFERLQREADPTAMQALVPAAMRIEHLRPGAAPRPRSTVEATGSCTP